MNIHLGTVVHQLLPFLHQCAVSVSFCINGQLQQKQNPTLESCFEYLMHADDIAWVTEDADNLRVVVEPSSGC